MESLDVFRHSWQEELARDKSQIENNNKDISIGDLSRIGLTFKNTSIDCQISNPLLSSPINSSFHSNSHNGSFTIGIQTFVSSNSKVSTNEPPTKKCKTSNISLLDELIRDIDELTDIPFFNISLPREIALQIFKYLSLKDLYSCLQVCKSWHSLSSDELLWYKLYKQMNFDFKSKKINENWKDSVKEITLLNRQIIQNFRAHQCRTTKLTNRLGIVLTCANNNSNTIIAGYSTGIIRTWSIDGILNANDDDDEQLSIPDIIYESIDNSPSCVQSVGFVKNDLYAIHNDGLIEIWTNNIGDKPRFTQHISSLPIRHITNDEQYLCAASSLKFFVWNINQSNILPKFDELNFFNDFNDHILSFCQSSHHTIPIAILAGRKSFWCLSLNNLSNRLSFYSTFQLNSFDQIPLDIHTEEPLAIIGFDNEIKLFDLLAGRCNIITNNYKYLPSNVNLIRANHCPINEFLVAYDNSQISIFDRRQKDGAIQHFFNHFSTITTLQMDTWKLISTDNRGFVRLWDRRMHPHSLWHMNPQSHPITHCSFDKQTLIYALTPYCKYPDTIDYQINSNSLSGHIYVCNFNSDISTRLDDDLKICTSSYDAPQASNRRIGLHTPYEIIE